MVTLTSSSALRPSSSSFCSKPGTRTLYPNSRSVCDFFSCTRPHTRQVAILEVRLGETEGGGSFQWGGEMGVERGEGRGARGDTERKQQQCDM